MASEVFWEASDAEFVPPRGGETRHSAVVLTWEFLQKRGGLSGDDGESAKNRR